MSILDTLAREHRVFGRLISRIEKSLKYGEAGARRELRDSILLLLTALERHDEIEDLVFGGAPDASGPSARRSAQHEVEIQHRKLRLLRSELLEALEDVEERSYERLKALTLLLTWKLRLHFQTEERRLWPHYLDFSSRSLGRSRDRLAKRRVRLLEDGVSESAAAISEYLGGPR